jgi:hypothetical protein
MLFAPACASTDGWSWTRLMLLGDQGHRPSYFLKAIEVAEHFGENDPRLHIARQNAAAGYVNDNPRLAEPILREDMLDLEKLDMDFPELVYDCFQLAKVCELQGKHEEAKALLNRALAIRGKWKEISSDDPFNAQLFASLYLIYYSLGQGAEAAKARCQMDRAVLLMRNEITRAHCLSAVSYQIKQYATSNHTLSRQRFEQLLKTAIGLSMQAADYFQKNGKTFNYAYELHLISDMYWSMGDSNSAENMTRQSLAIALNDFPNMSDLPLTDADCLSNILYSKNRLQEAQQVQERFLSQLQLAQQRGSVHRGNLGALRCFVAFWTRNGHPEIVEKLQMHAPNTIARLHAN